MNQLSLKKERKVSGKKSASLNKFMAEFAVSNMYRTFKAIYVKNCNTADEWYSNIESQVGGLKINSTLFYDVSITTYVYSYDFQKYVTKKLCLNNIQGTTLVKTCFNEIDEISHCDIVVFELKVSEGQKIGYFQDSKYDCCYLFARK